MDYFNISTKGKFKLARWINKRYRELCISELVKNSKDERQLFAMCRYIDRWYDQHEPYMKPIKASMELSEEIEVQQEASEEVVETMVHVVPEKHTRLKQHNFSKHVSHRLNVFITNNPEVGISKMIANAATEDDLMAAMDKIDSEKAYKDPLIKIWTVRQVV